MSVSIPIHELSSAELVRLESRPDWPVHKLIHLVLLIALKDRATEVVFEPRPDEIRLAYRVDGTLHDMVPPPAFLADALTQVFCELAGPDGKLALRAGGG